MWLLYLFGMGKQQKQILKVLEEILKQLIKLNSNKRRIKKRRVVVKGEEERRLKELVADFDRLGDACFVWMEEFDKSRSSFYRLLREIRAIEGH